MSGREERSEDAIRDANDLLRQKGYGERDLAVHAGLHGRALLKGNRILSPLSDDGDVVLRVVRELVPPESELGAKLLRPAELRAKLGLPHTGAGGAEPGTLS